MRRGEFASRPVTIRSEDRLRIWLLALQPVRQSGCSRQLFGKVVAHARFRRVGVGESPYDAETRKRIGLTTLL